MADNVEVGESEDSAGAGSVGLLVGEEGSLLEVDVLHACRVGAQVADPAVSQVLPPNRLQVTHDVMTC